MMQSCASAAKLRGGGPILNRGSNDHVHYRVATTSDRYLLLAIIRSSCRKSWLKLLCLRTLHRRAYRDSSRCDASCRHPPKDDEELAGQRHNHCLAQAAAGLGGSLAIPSGQRAVLLMQQVSPGELDHAAADPCVAGFGESAFSPLLPALIGRPGQTGVSRHSFSVS